MNYCKTIPFFSFSLDGALNIYKGHLIGWSSQLFLFVLLYYAIFKRIKKFKKCHTVRTVPTSNRKIVKRGHIYTRKTAIYDRSLSLVDTVTLFKSDQVKFVSRSKISPLSGMMWSYKSFTHASNMPTLTYNMTNSIVCILELIFVTYKMSYI